MANIIGLTKIKEEIEKTNNLPNSFCLVGGRGSGKHILANYIKDKFFKIEYLDITSTLEEEFIENIYRYPQKRLYIINIDEIVEKKQNILLKFLEEPFENIYICLLVRNSLTLLPTIKNRVTLYYLDTYTKEELLEIAKENDIDINPKYLINILKTPGDVLRIKTNNIDLDKIESLVEKMLTKMNIASFPNTLSIVDKINFNDEYDKIDVVIFLEILYYRSVTRYLTDKEDKSLEIVNIISSTIRKINRDSRLDKKKALSKMLIELWELNHKWN